MGHEERTALTPKREWSRLVLEVIFSVPDAKEPPQPRSARAFMAFRISRCRIAVDDSNPLILTTHALSLGLMQASLKCCAEHISGLPFPFC